MGFVARIAARPGSVEGPNLAGSYPGNNPEGFYKTLTATRTPLSEQIRKVEARVRFVQGKGEEQ